MENTGPSKTPIPRVDRRTRAGRRAKVTTDADRRERWRKWLLERLMECRLTRYRLAEIAGIDKSLVLKYFNEGTIPAQRNLLKLGRALGVTKNQVLLAAGYTSGSWDGADMALAEMGDLARQWAGLDGRLRSALVRLPRLSGQDQWELSEYLTVLLEAKAG